MSDRFRLIVSWTAIALAVLALPLARASAQGQQQSSQSIMLQPLPGGSNAIGTVGITNTIGSGDPCLNPSVAKISAPISVSSAATTSIIPVSGAKSFYTCDFQITVTGLLTTAASAQFEYGSGASCSSPVALTGTMQGQAIVGSTITLGPSGYGTQFVAPSGTGICLVTTGTSPSFQGYIVGVQQ
jgi:hypothetical protein